MSSISTPFLQSTHEQPDGNAKRPPKRTRTKNVMWPTPEKMLQVCLFVAEDAPALLASVSQDLLEAKKAKLTHISSANNLPSGSEGAAATKRAKLDIVAISAMVAQLEWRCPEQFSYHPSWLVAVGDESSEVPMQQHREVRTLEAFYPRVSVIPASSMEPSEAPSDLENTYPAEIPLISVEDEEEELRVDALLEGKEAAVKGTKVNFNHSPASPKNVENSDPDIAAAAAAAFAVLKAQENGTLIDHELLIKILSNPLLMEAFKASNIVSARTQCEDTSPFISKKKKSDNGNSFMLQLDPLGKGTSPMGALGPLSSCIAQERERYDSSESKALLQGNSMRQPCGLLNGGLSEDRAGLWKPGKGILGHGKNGVFGLNISTKQCNPLLSKDISRKPLSQSRIISNGAFRQSMTPMAVHEVESGNALEWARPITGPNHQSSLEGILDPLPPALKGKALRDKPPGVKVKRHCFFFNTPKGCRNGIYCNFLHDSPHVEPNAEKINQPDVAQQNRESEGTLPDTQVEGDTAK